MILVRVHEQEQVVIHRVEVFPCILGRSMHCGIRIDDLSVSARHAELHADPDGDYLLRDLGSTNGIRHGQARISELRLTANETVYLGDVRVDLRTEDLLERTHGNRMLPSDHMGSSRWLPAKTFAALLLAFVGMAVGPALDQYQIFWPPDSYADLISRSLTIWLSIVGAALLVSLFCKLNAKRFFFHNVLLLITAAVLVAKLWSVITPILVFNLHNLAGARLLRHVGYGLVTYWLAMRLQRYAFRRWLARHRAGVAAVLALLAIVLTEGLLERRGDRQRMADLGLPLGSPSGMKQSSEDLFFAVGLGFTAVDELRITTLKKLEADREAN